MSEKVRDNLPFKLLSEWRSLLSGKKATPHDDMSAPNVDFDEAEKLPEIFTPLQHGTTALTVVKEGRDLLIGNLGKSGAILGTRDTDNNLIVEQLRTDMKPNLAIPHVSYRRLALTSSLFSPLVGYGSNKEAVDIVASAPCKELASKALVDHAVHAWRVGV
ncbi:hypothetical protein LUZ60_012601 [Juncus effusus]|nr:hypothetical protein LUZ60_012601 [Juncus effusus]